MVFCGMWYSFPYASGVIAKQELKLRHKKTFDYIRLSIYDKNLSHMR